MVGGFLGSTVRHVPPRAAPLGTLAGVSIAFISMRPALEMFMTPAIGMVCFAIILVSWFGGVRFFKGIPAGLVAIAAGTLIAWGSAGLGLDYGGMSLAKLRESVAGFGFSVPLPAFGHVFSGFEFLGVILVTAIPSVGDHPGPLAGEALRSVLRHPRPGGRRAWLAAGAARAMFGTGLALAFARHLGCMGAAFVGGMGGAGHRAQQGQARRAEHRPGCWFAAIGAGMRFAVLGHGPQRRDVTAPGTVVFVDGHGYPLSGWCSRSHAGHGNAAFCSSPSVS